MVVHQEVFKRVFAIKCGGSTGSSVVLDVDGKQYLCTAKHVVAEHVEAEHVEAEHVEGSEPRPPVKVFLEKDWSDVNLQLVGCGTHNTDICVFAPGIRLVDDPYDVFATSQDITYGQEVFFLGFPFWLSQISNAVIGRYQVPIVKRGIVSGMLGGKNEVKRLIIDGLNNPGFSGGPLVYVPLENPRLAWRVAAIVTSYIPEIFPVLEKLSVHRLSETLLERRLINPDPAREGLKSLVPPNLLVSLAWSMSWKILL